MSCYNWERGTIYLQRYSFVKVRSAVFRELRRPEAEEYENAIKLYDAMRNTPRKKGVNWYRHYSSLRTLTTHGRDGYSEVELDPRNRFFARAMANKPPIVPKQKDYFTVPRAKSARGDFFYTHPEELYTINLLEHEDKSGTVEWDVPEGDRARERAHADPVGVALFDVLMSVGYGRGFGGTIKGGDEYTTANGGSSYVTATFARDSKFVMPCEAWSEQL